MPVFDKFRFPIFFCYCSCLEGCLEDANPANPANLTIYVNPVNPFNTANPVNSAMLLFVSILSICLADLSVSADFS